MRRGVFRGFDMRLFWMAWGLAVLLIGAAIGGSAWVLTASAAWPLLPLTLLRLVCAAAIVIAFVGAFRLAILGTVALKRVLARNLAIVIAMELEDLRASVTECASALAETGSEAPALDIPAFLGKREEIRSLLGRATEHTLERVLVSLQSYNATIQEIERGVRAADAEAARQTVSHLRWKIGVVGDHIRQALSALALFRQPAT
jgi:hypothetical protein